MKFQAWRMVSGTLSGSCFVALTQIVTRDKVSGTLHYAVLCFAIAIPCMAAYCLYPPTFQREGGTWSLAYSLFHLLYLVVLLVTFFGLALLFFSISLLAGLLFCMGVFGAYRVITTGSSNKAGIEGFK
jgi:hypothetical protein